MKLFNLFDNTTVNIHGDLTTGIFMGIALTLCVAIALLVIAFLVSNAV